MDIKPFGIESISEWNMVFEDHFDGDIKGWEKNWIADNRSFSHILCSRWPENVEQENSILKLINKKESRGGQDYTSGSVQSKEHFGYGYFECAMKYAPQTGLNQSFWIMTNPAYSRGGTTFELDVNEGHWPSEITTNYHYMKDGVDIDQGGLHLWDSSVFDMKLDLALGFHVYGCLWTKDMVTYYYDGKVLRKFTNTFAHVPAPVRLSSAIVTWAGPVTDKIHNTFMQVDYVRVFNK
ncbi:MAG: glycoside hydrolase family 16 protein [Kiritimatiellae bacterium]|nr:glycoside hydrolase family 16 protein [Kiritimatiellia bacterium]